MAKGANTSESDSESRDQASDLDVALKAEQFFLVYQPTIDLNSNAFAGVEALIRWRHPVRGVVGPEGFIPELEKSGQIVAVGRWALATACNQGAAWHDRGYRFAVSVNVSVGQVERAELGRDVEDALTASGFDPALLVLEFPLVAFTRDESVAARIAGLKALGIRLAIDDFSPSEASLDALGGFPIDIVKLDRDFIAAMSKSSTSESFVRRLVDLAKTRNLQIFASGIEDAEQRKRLQIDKIDIGQGFLFSKPHEAEEIDRYLEDFSIFSGKPL